MRKYVEMVCCRIITIGANGLKYIHKICGDSDELNMYFAELKKQGHKIVDIEMY